MKKSLLWMMSLLVCGMMGLGLVSCSSDDDWGGDGDIDVRVVGTWIMNDINGHYSCGWKFNSDGTCAFGEWDYGGTPKFPSSDYVSWYTSGSTLYISAGPESARFTYNVSSDGTVLTLVATSSGDDYSEMAGVFTKLQLK